ncbi:MAG: UDP-3-O-[3-hydroxymyristoyl] glucosamine N-acyltransferase [Arenicella sp.]|jgi:UDP-3-O-[3-hydroxymyristoyl] glucosamine N-acyltransferase
MELTIREIAHLLAGELEGDGDKKVNAIAKIEEAQEGSISFLSNPKYEPYIYNTHASAVIVNKDFEPKEKLTTSIIKVEDAYSAFTILLTEYQRMIQFQKKGIEQPSFVHQSATTGENIYVGAFAYLGENCTIGDNSKIYPNAYIGDNVKIGKNTIIHAGAKIYSNTIIGDYCVIQAGCVIGSDGFGFAPQTDGTYKTIPQVGNVVIENHVDIGANTVVDCATMGSTIIRSGVKLDNLIQIAHNVEIGKNTVIAAQSGISGSSKIGENCMIAGQVGIAGHLSIADKVKLAAQSGIGKSIEDENVAQMGSPAFGHKAYLKSSTVFRKLPELQKRIEELERKLIG